MASKRYVGLLVIVSIVGVVVSFAAWGFLELIHQISQELYTHLPNALGYHNGPPTLLTSPAGTGQEPLIIVGVVVAYLVAVMMSPPPDERASAETVHRRVERTRQPTDARRCASAPRSGTHADAGGHQFRALSEHVTHGDHRPGATVSSNLLDVFLLSLLAMFNPSLLAAVTVMLLLPNPKRLMLGYVLGAYTTSITLGLLIVFSLHGSSTESTSKHTISPAEDIAIGLLLLLIAWILRTGRDQPFQERRRVKQEAKLQAKREAGKPTESLPLRLLGKGDPKVTFVVGALLSFPGVSYLDALDHIHKLNPGTVLTVLLVIYFCLMQQILIELPLLGYLFAPDRTQDAVTRFQDPIARRGRPAAVIGSAAVGVILIARGVITLL